MMHNDDIYFLIYLIVYVFFITIYTKEVRNIINMLNNKFKQLLLFSHNYFVKK